jgi:C-terminal processing protease CtpA/Prc
MRHHKSCDQKLSASQLLPAGTASPVAGNKLADKPVYVLTSSSTQSAAEYFVYNLKMLK